MLTPLTGQLTPLGVALLPRVLIEDSFAGANGDSLNGRTPDTLSNGSTWSVQGGAWTIQSNRARKTAGGAGQHYVRIDAGRSDVRVASTLNLVSSNHDSGLILRASTGGAYWLFAVTRDVSTTAIILYEYNGSSFLQRSRSDISPISTGDHELIALCSGTNFECYLDGVLRAAYSSSVNQTETLFGIRSYNSALSDGFDSFKLERY
jgi:hypothetical protein